MLVTANIFACMFKIDNMHVVIENVFGLENPRQRT